MFLIPNRGFLRTHGDDSALSHSNPTPGFFLVAHSQIVTPLPSEEARDPYLPNISLRASRGGRSLRPASRPVTSPRPVRYRQCLYVRGYVESGGFRQMSNPAGGTRQIPPMGIRCGNPQPHCSIREPPSPLGCERSEDLSRTAEGPLPSHSVANVPKIYPEHRMRPPRTNPSADVRSLEVGEYVLLVASNSEPIISNPAAAPSTGGKATAESIFARSLNSGPYAYFAWMPRCCMFR